MIISKCRFDTCDCRVDADESVIVPEICCQLIERGRNVRDELLNLANLPPTAKEIKPRVFPAYTPRNLDRGIAIASILNGRPVSKDLLKKYFTGMIEFIEEGYRASGQLIINDPQKIRLQGSCIFTDINLREYYEDHSGSNIGSACQDTNFKRQWNVPINFYENIECPVNQKKLRSKVREKLDVLNCSSQQGSITNALNNLNQCFVFSAVAPDDTSQKWLITRLIKQVNLNNRCHPPLIINIRENITTKNDYDLDEFLDKLSSHLRVKPDSIFDSGQAIIVIIHESRSSPSIQQEIHEWLWNIFESISTRSRKPKIFMFWLDEQYPYFYNDLILIRRPDAAPVNMEFYKLEPIAEISSIDVRDWSHDIYENDLAIDDNTRSLFRGLWQNVIDGGFVGNDLHWIEPRRILSQICHALTVQDGIEYMKGIWTRDLKT